MQWFGWFVHREYRSITAWVCEIVIHTDQQICGLHVGPKLNGKLELEKSARFIAEQFVANCPLFLINDHHQLVPMHQVINVEFIDKPKICHYSRLKMFKWLTTAWKKIELQS